MKLTPPKIPAKYQPRGFQFLHEDQDMIVVNKAPGILTVAALWEKENTVHNLLNQYLRKGNPRSSKAVYVVHRLDQATSGTLIFAKSESVQQFLKNHWQNNVKIYYAIVHGHMAKKTGLIESYLQEDEDYVVHSTLDKENGKLARTEYEVVQENEHFSLVRVHLLTGKKNQIRVHFAEEGHPLLGDTKYGPSTSKSKELMLHSFSIELTHPFKKQRILFQSPIPAYFKKHFKTIA